MRRNLTDHEKANQCKCGAVVMITRGANGNDICLGSHTTGDHILHMKHRCWNIVDHLNAPVPAPVRISVGLVSA